MTIVHSRVFRALLLCVALASGANSGDGRSDRSLTVAAYWRGEGAANEPALRYPPERERMAIALRTRTHALHFIEAAATIAALALLRRRRFASRVAGVIAPLAAVGAVDLACSVYRHSLSTEYGLSVEPWLPWVWDWTKATAITGGVAALLLFAAMWYARRSRTWWIGVWAGAVVVAVAGALIVPWVFDPLFYRFRPLSQIRPDLVPALEAVAQRAGIRIPPERIYVMDASAKTRTVNAYLTGYGPSKRIVLWDTTLNTLTPPQIQTVFAHEAGHYVLLHVPKSLGLFAVALFVAMYGLGRYLGRSAGDAGSVTRALLFFSILSFATEPAVNAYSRMQEHQADIFELEAMHGLVPEPGINSADVDVIMADLNLEHPRPSAFVTWWLYDHPPSEQRIRFALTYAPWKTGAEPRYIH